MIDATWALRLYARHRLSQLKAQDAVDQQQRQLRQLVRKAAPTRFGRDHRFVEIRSVADFQARVPVRDYEEMWHRYWQPDFPRLVDCSWPGTISFFALTSGTGSGATKHIPCSRDMTRSNGWAAIDLLVHHVANRPHSHVLGGKNFMLGGSTDLTEDAPGIRSGDSERHRHRRNPALGATILLSAARIGADRRLGGKDRSAGPRGAHARYSHHHRDAELASNFL